MQFMANHGTGSTVRIAAPGNWSLMTFQTSLVVIHPKPASADGGMRPCMLSWHRGYLQKTLLPRAGESVTAISPISRVSLTHLGRTTSASVCRVST